MPQARLVDGYDATVVHESMNNEYLFGFTWIRWCWRCRVTWGNTTIFPSDLGSRACPYCDKWMSLGRAA
jgi:hypothetical protein